MMGQKLDKDASGDQKRKDRDAFLEQFRSVNKLDSVDFMKIWCHYDQNKSGYLVDKELENFLLDLLKAKGGETTPANLKEYYTRIMSTFDINNDGQLEISEMARLLPTEHNFMEKFTGLKALSRENFDEICKHYDKDGTNSVGGVELMALLNDCFKRENQELSRPLLEQYAKTILEVYDVSGDGKIDFKELALVVAKAQGKSVK